MSKWLNRLREIEACPGGAPSIPAEAPSAGSAGSAGIEEMDLTEFARSGRSLRIRSRLFDGDVILLAADNAAIPIENELVVHRAFEMVGLLGQPEQLRKLHMVKKALDAEPVHPDRAEKEGGDALAWAVT
jgi:hypothetical protein